MSEQNPPKKTETGEKTEENSMYELRRALKKPMEFNQREFIPITDSMTEQEELHALINNRAIHSIKAVEEMRQHPFTLEQARKQVEELNEGAGIDMTEIRRKWAEKDAKRLKNPLY